MLYRGLGEVKPEKYVTVPRGKDRIVAVPAAAVDGNSGRPSGDGFGERKVASRIKKGGTRVNHFRRISAYGKITSSRQIDMPCTGEVKVVFASRTFQTASFLNQWGMADRTNQNILSHFSIRMSFAWRQ